MWRIKFLTGPQSGQTIQLKPGRNTVGRAPGCDVVIQSQNVSKEHAYVDIGDSQILLVDLGSRNGTFVDGKKIQTHRLQIGEKVSFFDVICELEKKSSRRPDSRRSASARSGSASHQSYQGNLALDQSMQGNLGAYSPSHASHQSEPAAAPIQGSGLSAYLWRYVEDVMLPGVYKLTEWLEYRTVLGLFVALFVVLVTALSTVPLMRILKSSIEKEAQSRAQTIARTLARDNKSAIMQGQMSLVSTENADREAGAQSYVISSMNGDIIAPPRMAGQYLTDIDFVAEARKSNQELVKQVNDSTVVAVAPIRFYDSRAGTDLTAAHAVIVYNMGTLAVDDGRTLSLFVQILFIAIVLGSLLYFFLYKVITYPVMSLNRQLDNALKSGGAQVASPVQFPELQKLATNITSAISRGAGGFASDNLQQFEVDRNHEMQNIVNLVGFAAITVNPNERVISTVNEHFLTQIGQSGQWNGLSIDNILDQALKLNLQGLIDRVVMDPSQIVTDQLEISSQNYEISAQGVQGSKSVAYVLIVFIPKGGGI